MIRFEEAISIIEKAAAPMSATRIALASSSGHVLAEDVFSDVDMPPFDKSAVDGYACRREDLSDPLKVLEIIAAGQEPAYEIRKGECSKLMTGGMVPSGADTVIMVEDTDILPGDFIRFTGAKTAANICYRAEDIPKGALVLRKGTLLRAQEVAVLASVGISEPLVYEPFRVGIITTGDELVEPQQKPGPAQIRNSNAWQLIAQVRQTGSVPAYYGIARDNEANTLELIEKAAAENQIVILTGGISVGDFDFVPTVLENAGFEILFRKLAVQPGKPSIFARRQGKFLFALPGNPVSGFVQFELLVRHLMDCMTGTLAPKTWIRLSLGADYKRKRSDRKAFIPVVLTPDGQVVPAEYHGSAHIHSYISAQGIMAVEIGTNELPKGTAVDVRLL